MDKKKGLDLSGWGEDADEQNNTPETVEKKDITGVSSLTNLSLIDDNYELPPWIIETPKVGNLTIFKETKAQKGVKFIEGERMTIQVPKEVLDTFQYEGINKQSAFSALLVWGLAELKRQNKTITIDLSKL